MKYILFVLFILTFSIYSQENVKEVTILHWNDFHARNQPVKSSKKDSATGESVYYYYGGTANMLGYVNKLRNEKSLVLNAGDDFQGTPVSTFTRGKSQIELLNLFSIDAFVLGNHEYDYSQYALDSALKLAQFNILSANIYNKLSNSTFGKPFIIKDINGVKTGILGISPPGLFELTLPKNVDNIVMLNTDSVIKAGIGQLKAQGCDLIVLLTHQGLDDDKKMAEVYYKDVDIIVGGHTHIPLFKPANQNGVVIVQAGSYSRWLGKLDLKVDVDKDTVISYYGKLIETVMDSAIYDKAAGQKVEEMVSSVGAELLKVIAELKDDWKASYNQETNLGQYEADAFRTEIGTDIAFINGGGLRKNLAKGNVTIGDIWEINPFGNELNVFSVSGKTLKEMLSNNIRLKINKEREEESGEMLNVSGLTYTYDSKKMDSDSMNILVSAFVDGKPVDDNKIYSIATNNYVVSQFKKFFGEVNEKFEVKETGRVDRDLIIEVVEKQKVIEPKFEKRIIDISDSK
ncbi:MAG: bifunctional metallophosphatase/5'-nucleotidase [Ignavibacteriae bacterium]|nr:MAG: bifunctional metallophosphatase/5'-nucleotidase [Ignavibacteriota bacterium]